MNMTTDAFADDAQAIQEVLANPKNLELLFKTVQPALQPGKRNLVYVLKQGNRLGHQTEETFALRTLYEDVFDNLVVLTSPFDWPGTNPFVYQTLGSKVKVLQTDNETLLMYGFLDGGVRDMGPFHLCMFSPQRLFQEECRHIAAGGAVKAMILPDTLRAKGAAWMQSVGFQSADKFVLLHIRDAGYRKDLEHHEYRCATVENYQKAIDTCLDAGYWVFRIGDKSSTPLNHPSDRVVDVPFHADYGQFLDLYLSAFCAFAINMMSGPEIIRRVFGRPAVTVNMVPDHLRVSLLNDVYVFKRFKDKSSGRDLSYSEVLERKIEINNTDRAYDDVGMGLVENSPDELDGAVQEIISQTESGQDHIFDDIDARFVEIGKAYENNISKIPGAEQYGGSFYGLAYPFGYISRSFLKSQPHFLG